MFFCIKSSHSCPGASENNDLESPENIENISTVETSREVQAAPSGSVRPRPRRTSSTAALQIVSSNIEQTQGMVSELSNQIRELQEKEALSDDDRMLLANIGTSYSNLVEGLNAFFSALPSDLNARQLEDFLDVLMRGIRAWLDTATQFQELNEVIRQALQAVALFMNSLEARLDRASEAGELRCIVFNYYR